MSKLKVQEATKELSLGASQLLEDISIVRRTTQDTLQSLKRLESAFLHVDEERREQQKMEAQRQILDAQSKAWTMPDSEEAVAAPPQTPVSEAAPQTPVSQASVADAPASQTPASQTPVSQTPASQTPVAQTPVSQTPASQAEAPAAQARPAQRPAQAAPGDAPRPVQGGAPARPFGQPPQGGQPRAYGQAPQGGPARPYGQAPQGGPARPYGQAPQGGPARPFGQAPQGGAPRPYGQPPQGGARPYGQAPGGAPRPYGQPPQGGARPYGQAPGGPRPYGQSPQGGRPPMGGGAPRPGGGMGGRPGMGGGRSKGPEITPTMEKERVSNYDPNKKMYVRQHDPERQAQRNRKQLTRGGVGGYDDDMGRNRKARRKPSAQMMMEPIRIEKAFMTASTITVKDLTERIGKPAGEIIKKLFLLGTMATINQELDFDMAQLIASEFGVELELKLAKTAEDMLTDTDYEDAETDLVTRPPVITIMGHVDHGKTSLLDYIRKAHVTAGEAGGITQHIGAYTVELDGRPITFLDTPGHEAFTAMRARGTQATDIAVLVVAADDGVMPQTIESINHAKAAKVPVIVAINKIDKDAADISRIKQDLTRYDMVAEDWGGDTIMVPVSALSGEGVDTLLENILLVADVQELRANPERMARGVIIEARLDKGRGPVATALVQNGTLHVGDAIVAGTAFGRVRAMMDARGGRVTAAGPSMPVEIVGFNAVPEAGDAITALEDERLARQVAEERIEIKRAEASTGTVGTTSDIWEQKIADGKMKDLNLIVKADVQGSVEAISQALEKLENEEVRVRIIHGGVGAVNENDVRLANADKDNKAIIIGFNVRPDNKAREAANRDNVDVRYYRIIYQAIEDVERALKGMLTPLFKENVLGHAEVRNVFKVTGVGTIAGCYVTDGKVQRNAQVRLLRDNVVCFEGKLDSLKRFKDDARDVASGYECGISLEKYSDIKELDIIECFLMEEIER